MLFSSSSSDDSDSSSDVEDINIAVLMTNNPATTGVTEQWVNQIESCSYSSNFQNAVAKGASIEKLCKATDDGFGEKDKINNGWILTNNNREECLIVSFEKPVFINEIHIYESLNPGSIVKLEMVESQKNNWYTMWQQKSHKDSKTLTHNIFKPLLRRYHLKSNTIRITIDPRYTDRIGIQAIKLIGSDIFDVNFHRITLPQAMMKLYQQTLDDNNNNNQTDAQFLIENKIINAHRNILCCRSPYFRALFLNDFSEKNQRKPIELTDVDYNTFTELLFFIYTGTYHQTMTYDLALQCMIYSNKINFLSGRDGALERICHYLRLQHDLILSTYCLLKQMSPTFDFLLDFIYELCSQYMNEICKQKEFSELDKDLVIDLICQTTARNQIRDQERNRQTTIL